MTDPGADPEAGADADRTAVSGGSAVAGDAASGDAGGRDGHSAPPLVQAGRWLRTVPATLGLCLVLGWVYVLELATLVVADRTTAAWWFLATPSPSPGWVLAPLAHTPADPVHLLANVALLVVFGGMTERRLGARATVAVLVVAGLGGTAGQVLSYALAGETGRTLGASGMALAATAFATAEVVRDRLATGRWAGEVGWLWALLGVAILGRRLVLDLVVGVPGVGRVGHLWGVLFGLALALFVSPAWTDSGGS